MTTASAPKLILCRYRLDEEIAAGGTARVWRGWDVQLDRPVAVKLLHPHLLPDETSRRRLAAEARAAAGLSDHAIATVYDVTGPDEDPAIVMELVDGEALSVKLARDGPMRPEAAARLAAEVAEALYHAHQRGIVHRDVKPANILVESGSGRARLIDFGIAHSLEAAAETLTGTGTAVGTPRYMAPEQLAGEQIGPRTDLWGLGCVLYEALSGRPPFAAGNPLAIARAQAAGPPPIEDVDPALEVVALSCLAANVADRPVHAGRVASALRSWLDGDPAPALALSSAAAVTQQMRVVSGAPDAGGEDSAAPVAPAAAALPSRRNQWPRIAVAALILALLLVVAAALAGALLGGPGAASPSPTPSAPPSATPPAAWRSALLADYRRACEDGDLTASDLAGMTEQEATRYVDSLIRQCTSGNEGKGKGHGNGKGGPGKD